MKYSNEQVQAGLDYVNNVYGYIKLIHGEDVANGWLSAPELDTKYFVEYNEAYEKFFTKIMNLTKRQKEAMEEIMLHRVYKRIINAGIDERLERQLSQLENY